MKATLEVGKSWDKLTQLQERYLEIQELLAQPEVATDSSRLMTLGKEYAVLEPIVASYKAYQQTLESLDEAQSIHQESADADIITLAQEEITVLEERQAKLEGELAIALSPKDPADERDVFVEIRAAAGGEEAALFAAEWDCRVRQGEPRGYVQLRSLLL